MRWHLDKINDELGKECGGLNKQELIMTVKPSDQAKQKSVELVSAQ